MKLGVRRLPRAMVVLIACFAISFVGALAPVFAQPRKPAVWATCVENIPTGATKPTLDETFPDESFAGYAAQLELVIKHGKGETVLPSGFRVDAASEAMRALTRSGFMIPEPDGGSPTTVTTEETADGATTKVSIPIVLLPQRAGRVPLTLPSLPIAISRANNEVMTICTSKHDIVAVDPTENEQDPPPRPNPPPRPQREEWELAKKVAIGIAIGILIGAILGYFLVKHLRRPKPAAPIVKRLPWVIALEELDGLRRSTLLSEGKKAEYYDVVSDCIRKYLGGRFGFDKHGFDGLETTTDEMRALLKRVRPPIQNLGAISEFLEDCDLVKFAKLSPSESDCLAAVVKAEAIVRVTIPVAPTAKPAPPANPTPPPVPPPEPRPPEANP
jgi:hypothetical protein